MSAPAEKKPEVKKAKPKLSFVENFALSGVAAVASKTVAAPIERIKLLVQNQGEMLKQGILSEPYNGVGDCFKKTVASEGVGSLWRGNLANCLRYFPTQALNFAFKDTIKGLVKADKKKDTKLLSFGKDLLSGGMAGGLSLCFVYSLDFARTRLANDIKKKPVPGQPAPERKYNGLIDVYKKTIASDGFAGLYRGFNISLVGIVVYRGFYFGLYDSLKPIILGANSGLMANFVLGYVVTVVSGIASYPLDTIRRRMMMTTGGGVKYKGSVDCGMQVLKSEGGMAFFKGAGANVLRGMAGAGVLAGFDSLTELYLDFKNK